MQKNFAPGAALPSFVILPEQQNELIFAIKQDNNLLCYQ